MGLDGEIADPVEKTLEGTLKVKVTVVAAESSGWQNDAGYSKKATVEVAEDGTTYVTYMVIYWGFGSDNTDTTKTKGFLIEGSPENGLSSTRAGYMQWDLTGETQTGKFIAAEFPSGESEGTPSNLTPSNYYLGSTGVTTDRAMYGRFKLNTSTKEVHVQGISIEEERKGGATAEAYGCFKFFWNWNKRRHDGYL